MTGGNLDTTNLLLGIMAAVSVLEALVLIVVSVMAYRLYTRTVHVVQEIDERRIAPLAARVDALMTRVDAILVDVKGMTSKVSEGSERVDSAIRAPVNRLRGLVNGARVAYETFFNNRRAAGEASGHA